MLSTPRPLKASGQRTQAKKIMLESVLFIILIFVGGTYESYKSENELEFNKPKLILLEDGTYKFEGMKGFRLEKNGTWKTGGIDGHFEFYNNNESLIEFASPFGGDGNEKIIFNLHDSNEVTFFKIKHQ